MLSEMTVATTTTTRKDDGGVAGVGSTTGLVLLFVSFGLVVHAAHGHTTRRERDHHHRHHHHHGGGGGGGGEEGVLFFGMSASVAMELAIAVAVGAYSVFSRRFGAFGRFKEVREERGDIPGLTVTRWSDFSSLWTRAKAL